MNNKEKLEEIIAFLSANTRFDETKNFIQHGNTSVYTHVISVAKNPLKLQKNII